MTLSTPLVGDPVLKALRISESRYRRLFETAQDGILLLNAITAQIEDVNPYLIEMLGYSHAEFLGKKIWEVGAFADIAQSKEMFAELQITGYVKYKDLPLKTKMGEKIAVEFVSNSYDCEGIKVIQCNIRNITERIADQAKILRHTQLYSALSHCNKAIVHSCDEDELFQQACQIAVKFGGMKMAWVGLIDTKTHMVQPVASFGTGNEYLQDIQISVDEDNPLGRGPFGITIREERPYWCQDFKHDPLTLPWHESAEHFGWASSATLPLRRGNVVIGAFILYANETNAFDSAACDLLAEMATDISFGLDNFAREAQRKQVSIENEHLAFYDHLTDLPNRRLLYDRLQQAITSSARHRKYGAALFIDLDHFKIINDTLGHSIGDLLLIETATRLQGCVRKEDTVARLGGDEFVVLLQELSESPAQAAAQAEAVGGKILAAIRQPNSLIGNEYNSSTSIGISLFHDQTQTVDDILKRTDIAMYQAKDAGRDTLRFYDAEMQAKLEDRMAMEKDLHSALLKKQFQLYYQMQTDHAGHIHGAEALIRWFHPTRGPISPTLFIPLAEESGLILLVGQWVLETACDQLKAWESDILTSELQLAVNVSARQFHQPEFVELVQQAIHTRALNPNQLKIELTESLVLDNIDDTIVKMQALREFGVRFAMDDFGTGYSSLSYLSQLPLDQLKIDQSFVHNISVKPRDSVIVQTIIGMAKNLGMEVIAEGVETEEQRAFLEQHGCGLCQGFLFARPVPIEEFTASLEKA